MKCCRTETPPCGERRPESREVAGTRILLWEKIATGVHPRQLGTFDVATLHLACADGLPGAARMDFDRCIATLDAWAGAAGRYTERVMPQFRRVPHEYNGSEAYFRSLCLITVLQRDMGLRYNPAKIP